MLKLNKANQSAVENVKMWLLYKNSIAVVVAWQGSREMDFSSNMTNTLLLQDFIWTQTTQLLLQPDTAQPLLRWYREVQGLITTFCIFIISLTEMIIGFMPPGKWRREIEGNMANDRKFKPVCYSNRAYCVTLSHTNYITYRSQPRSAGMGLSENSVISSSDYIATITTFASLAVVHRRNNCG